MGAGRHGNQHAHKLCGALAAAAIATALATSAVATPAWADGSIELYNAEGTSTAYTATRIASADGLPIEGAYDWRGLAGSTLGSFAMPSWDGSEAQGFALAQALGTAVSNDPDGAIAAEAAKRLSTGAQSQTVTTNGGPVDAEDGWWLLAADGRCPMFVWVADDAKRLGEKSDVPTVSLAIAGEDGKWGTGAGYGAGTMLSYRVRCSVPTSIDAVDTYPMSLNLRDGGKLLLVDGSVCVTLASGDKSTDITDHFKVETAVQALAATPQRATVITASTDDLKAAGARPGDVVELTLKATAPAENDGSKGLSVSAWATYPAATGEGMESTEPVITRAYTAAASVRLVDAQGAAPLAGGTFAVMNADGKWLATDGVFGDEASRASFETASDGTAALGAALAPGTYTLVQLSAPAGYDLPQQPRFAFAVKQAGDADGSRLTVESQDLTVESVDAQSDAFVLRVANAQTGNPGPNPGPNPSPTPNPGNDHGSNGDDTGDTNLADVIREASGRLAQTGDFIGAHLAQVLSVLAGAACVAAAAVVRRRHKTNGE